MYRLDKLTILEIQAAYALRDERLSCGDHKGASEAHVEFHRLVYRNWPAIFVSLHGERG